MLTDEHASGAASVSDGAAPWAQMLRRHRAEWVSSLAGERPVTDALDPTTDETAVVWLDELTGDANPERTGEALRALAAQGRPLIVGLPADAGGDAARAADRLASELGGFTLVQHLAAGSLIAVRGSAGSDVVGGEETPAATIEEPGCRGDAVHYLVCVNVEPASAARARALLGARAVPLMTGYVRFLEEANRSLGEANARLARERLGVHDTAAAATLPWIADLERELEHHRNMLFQARAALDAPRYRAVDRLRAVIFGIPGLSMLFGLRSRLIQRRRAR